MITRHRTSGQDDPTTDADTDLDAVLEQEFGPQPTVEERSSDRRSTDRGATHAPRDHQTHDFGRVDTTSQALQIRDATHASPVLCDLTYESRMEANLYISRTLLGEPRCRIMLAGRAVAIERRGGGFVATDADGAVLARSHEVPLLLVMLLDLADS